MCAGGGSISRSWPCFYPFPHKTRLVSAPGAADSACLPRAPPPDSGRLFLNPPRLQSEPQYTSQPPKTPSSRAFPILTPPKFELSAARLSGGEPPLAPFGSGQRFRPQPLPSSGPWPSADGGRSLLSPSLGKSGEALKLKGGPGRGRSLSYHHPLQEKRATQAQERRRVSVNSGLSPNRKRPPWTLPWDVLAAV